MDRAGFTVVSRGPVCGGRNDVSPRARNLRPSGEGGSLDRALTLENIAVVLRAEARYAESEKLHREALPKLEELTGPASLATARAVSNLAALYWSSGKLEQAEPLALRAETAFHDLPGAGPGGPFAQPADSGVDLP